MFDDSRLCTTLISMFSQSLKAPSDLPQVTRLLGYSATVLVRTQGEHCDGVDVRRALRHSAGDGSGSLLDSASVTSCVAFGLHTNKVLNACRVSWG